MSHSRFSSSLKYLELDPAVAAAADVVVTHMRGSPSHIFRTEGANLAKDTEHKKASLKTAMKQDELPTLPELLLGQTPGRGSASDITLFLNYIGLGYQFVATGYAVYRRAKERGIGRVLDTDWFTSAVPS